MDIVGGEVKMLSLQLAHAQITLYHVFIDFKNDNINSKTTFDRVWHAALWATTWEFFINASFVCVTERFYENATSAVRMSDSMGEWFRTSDGVRQDHLSHTSSSTFLWKNIMER